MSIITPPIHTSKAVVLAAGMGSRLNGHEIPKPLVKVNGDKMLIEHTLQNLARAGATEIFVVLGFRAEDIQRELKNIRIPNAKITTVYNPDWKKPNGLSLYAAKDVVEGRFFLTMSDHIFDHSIASDLNSIGVPDGAVRLAVDSRIDQIFDIDDATKVRTNGEYIVNIGKELKEFDAIDTGIFLCTDGIFTALEESFEAGEFSLSGGMKRLANKNKFLCMDISNRYWQDVDDPKMLAKAREDIANGIIQY